MNVTIDAISLVYILLAFLVAALVSFGMTPVVKVFAGKIGAIDIPKDNRRMHDHPLPRLGGLAIFFAFLVSVLIFVPLDNTWKATLLGAVIIVILGIFDDVYRLKPLPKFIVQIIAALIPALSGLQIDFFTNFNNGFINLGALSVPITVFWIVGMTNAVNFIDGLDALACGVSSIACFSLLCISLITGQTEITIITAALTGACIGFLPYNFNPSKIIMGDTGSTFLGYILAVISVDGLFKFYTIISFAVPFLILGIPIFDTAFAIVRRVAKGRTPWSPDRGHLHHRLIDMGFSQKQSVAIIYAVSIVCSIAAVLLTTSGTVKAIVFVITALIVSMLAGKLFLTDDKKEEKKTEDQSSK